MKVLYLYSGTRNDKYHGIAGVDYPDTQFYGLQHMKDFGIDAEYKEFESFRFGFPLGFRFGRFFARIVGFRIKHLLMYFVARKYDIVLGISVLYLLFWKKIFPTKTKFIIFNSVLNRMLIVHKEGTVKFKILLWLLKEVDGIVFLARVHMNKVIEKIPFLKDKVFFVPMGVDSVYYKPVFEGRDNFFLSVGRDNARDYKTVIEVARRMPEEMFHLVCLPRNIAGIKDIPENVKIHVNIPLVELQEMYRKAKALLLIMHNDSYVEGSDSSGPTVLLEAMAIGLPIIVSRKQYLEDYVKHEKDALIVDFYDENAIIESIRKISDDSLRQQMARSARDKVDSIFNTKEMAGALSEVFKEVYDK